MIQVLSYNFYFDNSIILLESLFFYLFCFTSIVTLHKITDTNQNKIDCKDFILNVSKSMIEKDNKEIELTKNEIKILYFLISKRGQIVSREDIINYLWDSESFIDDNTLTVNMKRLRTKLEEIDLEDMIETKRGQGYILK